MLTMWRSCGDSPCHSIKWAHLVWPDVPAAEDVLVAAIVVTDGPAVI